MQQRRQRSAHFQLQIAAEDVFDLTVVLSACIAQIVSAKLSS